MRRASIALAVLVAASVPVLGYHDPRSGGSPPQLSTYLAVQRRAVPAATVVAGFHDWRAVSKYRAHAGEHLGYDVAMRAGSPAVAGWSGRVTRIVPWYDVEYGISVLSPNGYETTYGHLRPTAHVGDELRAGDEVGKVVNDHVDIKMRAPDGLYYDFGTAEAVAGNSAGRAESGTTAAAERRTASRTTAAAERRTRTTTSVAERKPAPRPTAAIEQSPAPRPTAAIERRTATTVAGRGDTVAMSSDGTRRPWRTRLVPDRAELLRRYLRARYSVDLTREEAERAVQAERAAHQAFERNRKRLEEMARRAGLPVDLRKATAEVEQLAAQLRHRERDVATLQSLLRRDEQALAGAARALYGR